MVVDTQPKYQAQSKLFIVKHRDSCATLMNKLDRDGRDMTLGSWKRLLGGAVAMNAIGMVKLSKDFDLYNERLRWRCRIEDGGCITAILWANEDIELLTEAR